MCTAAVYRTDGLYFGRTLDYDTSYGEEVVVTPRNAPLHFRAQPVRSRHYAMLGMAHVEDGQALYYEAFNEKGLCMAGLNFVGNAVYREAMADCDNVAQFELIPWILGACASLEEARARLVRLNLWNISFRPGLPAAQLHWMLADRSGCIVVEQTAAGLRIFDNPVGVLTNNPPFDQQYLALSNFMHLSPGPAENRLAPGVPLPEYSRGMGAIGLPGDLSSQSRFVRAAFAAQHACSGRGEMESVSQFFHILGTVDQPRGCCRLENGACAFTLYTCCCSADRGVYYYTTYNNHQLTAVDLYRTDLEGATLLRYALAQTERICWQNA